MHDQDRPRETRIDAGHQGARHFKNRRTSLEDVL